MESDLVSEERPEIKSENGYANLTTVDLLSLILGSSNTSIMSRARQIMKLADEKISNLRTLNEQDLLSIKGVGITSAKAILAAVELGHRIALETPEVRYSIFSADGIYRYMRPRIGALEHEEFWVMLMNNNYKLIKAVKISSGGLTETVADIRVMMREAVLNNATVIACAHNHPSGDTKPSKIDNDLTKRIKDACEIMRLYLVDHVIVTNGGYYSYAESGKL